MNKKLHMSVLQLPCPEVNNPSEPQTQRSWFLCCVLMQVLITVDHPTGLVQQVSQSAMWAAADAVQAIALHNILSNIDGTLCFLNNIFINRSSQHMLHSCGSQQ